MSVINTAMTSLMKTLTAFPRERAIVDKERAAGSYGKHCACVLLPSLMMVIRVHVLLVTRLALVHKSSSCPDNNFDVLCS